MLSTDGLQFFTSANGVILSPGNEDGTILPLYFSAVIQRRPSTSCSDTRFASVTTRTGTMPRCIKLANITYSYKYRSINLLKKRYSAVFISDRLIYSHTVIGTVYIGIALFSLKVAFISIHFNLKCLDP